MSEDTYATNLSPNLTEPIIQLRNGLELPVNILPESTQKFYELNIVEEEEDGFVLNDENGNEFYFPNLKYISGSRSDLKNKLILRNHEYQFYKNRSRDETNRKLFFDNFNLIYNHRDLILSDSRYFLTRVHGELFTGGLWVSPYDYCLGGVLESWENNDALITHFEDSTSPIFIFKSGGNALSGSHEWTGWSEDRQTFIGAWAFGSRKPPNDRYINSQKKFSTLYLEFRKIRDLYPDYCNVETSSLKQLIEDLKALNGQKK